MKEIKSENIKNIEKYYNKPEITREQIKAAIDEALIIIDKNIEDFSNNFPASASVNHVYSCTENTDWTPAFWTGMLWLAYEVTNDEKYKKVAEIQCETYKNRIEKRINTETHDLGFLYTLSCVSAYKLTKNEEYKDTALKAADALMERYNEKAGIIQAWGDLNDPSESGRMIVDCSMNIPLLYWAFEVTGNKKYYDAAYSHIQKTGDYIVRDDASTFHTFYMDVETGEPRFGTTHQGNSDNSCWARGQAWAIYGFPLSYKYTSEKGMLDISSKVANYFINRLPEDDICYWDLVFTSGNEERDSSSAAIAICGLDELSKGLSEMDDYKTIYKNAGLSMLKSLIDNYAVSSKDSSNGLLFHAVYSKPHNRGVDECCIWGDYYYMEALVRAYKDWELYW